MARSNKLKKVLARDDVTSPDTDDTSPDTDDTSQDLQIVPTSSMDSHRARTARKVYEVVRRILSMQRREQIVLELSEEWGVSFRSVDKMIAKATKIIREKSVEDVEAVVLERVQQLEQLFADCIAVGDRRTAVLCSAELNKLQGLTNQKVDITSGGLPLGVSIIIQRPPDDDIQDAQVVD